MKTKTVEIEDLNEMILDLFTQGTLLDGERYDNMCISAYEDAQKYLIEIGLVNKSECVRK